MSKRARFEGLLHSLMVIQARKPLKPGEKAMVESPRTFREGFRQCLIALDLIKESTTELTEKQMDILIDRLAEMTGEVPPTPESPDDGVST